MNAVSTASIALAPISEARPFHLPLHQLALFAEWPPRLIEPRPPPAPRLPRQVADTALNEAEALPLIAAWLHRSVVAAPPPPKAPALPALASDGSLRSDLVRRILELLQHMARSGAEVPGNPELAERLGVLRQTTARVVRQLEAANYFVIEVRTDARRFVFPDGAATGWGTFRKGHAPGPPRRDRAAPAEAPPPAPLLLRGPPPLPREPLDLRAPDRCQYPTWEDYTQAPKTGLVEHVCGAPALRGESWCLAHLSIVSPGRARRHERRRESLLQSTSLCCN